MGEKDNTINKTDQLKAEILNLRFKEVHDKLDESKILLSKILTQTEITSSAISTMDKRIFVLEDVQKNCNIRKIHTEFEEFKQNNKVVNYFSSHPKTTGVIAITILVISSYIKPTFTLLFNILKQIT